MVSVAPMPMPLPHHVQEHYYTARSSVHSHEEDEVPFEDKVPSFLRSVRIERAKRVDDNIEVCL
jgi:hypothetical protein